MGELFFLPRPPVVCVTRFVPSFGGVDLQINQPKSKCPSFPLATGGLLGSSRQTKIEPTRFTVSLGTEASMHCQAKFV